MERDTAGKGGPNQELAVGGCLDLEEDEPIVVCAIDSDGTDGPTQIAGAITDGSTLVRAGKNGFDCFKALMDHNTAEMLETLDDAVCHYRVNRLQRQRSGNVHYSPAHVNLHV